MSLPERQVYVIVGPTASGKTKLAIEWAQKLGCEILNFDSRQVYQELSIGVARPEEVELKSVPHHFIASHTIHNPLDAARFAEEARQKTASLIQKHGKVVLVGGTGLYLKAYLEGLDNLPPIEPSLRAQVKQWYENDGIFGVAQRLYEIDSQAFEYIQKDNPARVIRALEICLASGQKVAEWRKSEGVPLAFSFGIWGIETERHLLYDRINKRVHEMLEAGFEAEIERLAPYQDLAVLKTVGYREFFAYRNGAISRDTAISLMQQKTRNYAKRQITWFKNQTHCQWDSLENLRNFAT